MAASTTYTTSTLIGKVITPNFDTSSSGIDATEWTEIIATVSRDIDARLGRKYVPFNSTSSTPPTPKTITKIASWLGAALATEVIRGVHRGSDYEVDIDGWNNRANEALDRLLKGDDTIPEEQVTAEALTWGTGGSYDLTTSQAFLAIANYAPGGYNVTVDPLSIRVTTTGLTKYHMGRDIKVDFHPDHQRWYVTDRVGSLVAAASPAVSYRWTYERYTEFRKPGIRRSGKFQWV